MSVSVNENACCSQLRAWCSRTENGEDQRRRSGPVGAAAAPPARAPPRDEEQRQREYQTGIASALYSAITMTDAVYLSLSHENDATGSTACVAVVGDDVLVVGNVGDSRAVLSRRSGAGAPGALPLSHDHKCRRPDELARIQRAGGVVFDWNGSRVMGILAMSRAIGDRFLRPFVVPEPELVVLERERGRDEFIVVASDGLWDVMGNAAACAIVRGEMPEGGGGAETAWCVRAAARLAKAALDLGCGDNTSVVVVSLRER